MKIVSAPLMLLLGIGLMALLMLLLSSVLMALLCVEDPNKQHEEDDCR